MLQRSAGRQQRHESLIKKHKALSLRAKRLAEALSRYSKQSGTNVGRVIPLPIVKSYPISRAVEVPAATGEACPIVQLALADGDSEQEAGQLLKVCLDSKTSFRSLVRTIRSLAAHKLYRGRYLPSPNTLIYWAIRAGVAKLRSVTVCDEGSIDIMDHWIGIGNLKVLAIMRLRQSTCDRRQRAKQALTLADFELIHLEIMLISNGEKMRDVLTKVYAKVGHPLGVICDNGSDLRKGLKLFNASIEGDKVEHIQDISHKIACIIKKQYSGLGWFQKLSKNIRDGQSKLTNSQYAHLRSPKQNTKARFMNIAKVIDWAMWALQYMQKEPGTTEEADAVRKFREVYQTLHQHSKKMLPHMKKPRPAASLSCVAICRRHCFCRPLSVGTPASMRAS